MKQQSESNTSILSTDPDKIEKYNALLQKVTQVTKNATDKGEKRAGYSFIVLIKSGINETNNSIFFYLNGAIEHLIRYFAEDLDNFIDGKEQLRHTCYELLHNLARTILQTAIHRRNLKKFKEFCFQI